MASRTEIQLSLLDWTPPKPVDGLLSPDMIYQTDQLSVLCSLPEDHRFDRKSARVDARTLAVCLSAFGNSPNATGGVVAIGLDDQKAVEGCKHLSDASLASIEKMGHDSCPSGKFHTRRVPVKNKNGEDDFIILARVYYVENQLVELTNGDAYTRFSDTNRRLQEEEKQEIRINKGEVSFEQQSCALKYPDDFQTHRVSQFLSHLRRTYSISPETGDFQILEMYHLGKRDGGGFIPNNACAIVFAKDPRTIFPGCYVHFLRYEGEQEGSGKNYNVIKDRIFIGNVLEQIEGVASFLETQLREFTMLDERKKFFTVPEYPKDAWYELLVNACVHRSYNIRNAPIFIKMFDDKLLVESPGGFMPQVNPETIYEMHRPRNPFIMHALREFGEVRCINEGTKRVRNEMAEAKLPAPIFSQVEQNQASVRVVLKNDIKHRKNSLDTEAYRTIGDALALSLSHDERKVINYVMEKGYVRVSDVLRIISTTRWHTGKALLDELFRRGILDYIPGKRPRDATSHYVLHKNDADSIIISSSD